MVVTGSGSGSRGAVVLVVFWWYCGSGSSGSLGMAVAICAVVHGGSSCNNLRRAGSAQVCTGCRFRKATVMPDLRNAASVLTFGHVRKGKVVLPHSVRAGTCQLQFSHIVPGNVEASSSDGVRFNGHLLSCEISANIGSAGNRRQPGEAPPSSGKAILDHPSTKADLEDVLKLPVAYIEKAERCHDIL